MSTGETFYKLLRKTANEGSPAIVARGYLALMGSGCLAISAFSAVEAGQQESVTKTVVAIAGTVIAASASYIGFEGYIFGRQVKEHEMLDEQLRATSPESIEDNPYQQE